MAGKQRTPEQEARRQAIVQRITSNETVMAGYLDSKMRSERGEKGVSLKQILEEMRARSQDA